MPSAGALLKGPMTYAEKLEAIRREIHHAQANGHHLDEACQGMEPWQFPLPAAVRIDRLLEILDA